MKGTPEQIKKQAKVITNIFKIDQENGKTRLIFDGRKPNEYLESNSFVLCHASILLRRKWTHCTKIDLKNAFMHFPVS